MTCLYFCTLFHDPFVWYFPFHETSIQGKKGMNCFLFCTILLSSFFSWFLSFFILHERRQSEEEAKRSRGKNGEEMENRNFLCGRKSKIVVLVKNSRRSWKRRNEQVTKMKVGHQFNCPPTLRSRLMSVINLIAEVINEEKGEEENLFLCQKKRRHFPSSTFSFMFLSNLGS